MKFLESAFHPKVSLWYYILVIFLAFAAANTIGATPLGLVLSYAIWKNGISNIDPNTNLMDPAIYGISSNVFLFFALFCFVIGFVTLILLIKAFNKKSFQYVINGTQRIRWKRIMWGAGVWAFVLAVYTAIDYMINPENFVLQFNFAAFIPLLFISLLLIPIQTSFEELAFRGYLTQGIAGATRNRWWALVIPSLVFGLIHCFNPEVSAHGFWLTMPNYILFGVLFGLTSILDDGIEIALGIHAANNIFLSLFVTNPDSALRTNAIFEQQSIEPAKDLIGFIITGILVFLFFYKKYHWNWKIMNQKVEETSTEDETVTSI